MTQKYDIAIIGVGTVGFAVGGAFETKGYSVLYIDKKQEVIANLRHKGKHAFLPANVTSLPSDISFICVPTPTISGEGMDSGALQSATLFLGDLLRSGSTYHLVVIKSTVLPGTTEEFVIPQLEHVSGKTNGQEFSVCINPEYLRGNSAINDAEHPWIIVIGKLAEGWDANTGLRASCPNLQPKNDGPKVRHDFQFLADCVEYTSFFKQKMHDRFRLLALKLPLQKRSEAREMLLVPTLSPKSDHRA